MKNINEMPFNFIDENGKNQIFYGANESMARLKFEKHKKGKEEDQAKEWRRRRNLLKRK